MAVTVHYLRAKVKSSAHNVVFKAGKVFDRIEEFFVVGNDPPGTPFVPPLVGQLQDGVKAASLAALDYLPSFGGVPLFSPKFVHVMGELLKNEVEFHPCSVICEETSHEFFVARLLQRRHLLDYPSSGLGEGAGRFQSNFIRSDLDEDFLLAREQHELKCYVFVASERFKQAVEKLKLGIAFNPAAVQG
jgi:hypothetical protein